MERKLIIYLMSGKKLEIIVGGYTLKETYLKDFNDNNYYIVLGDYLIPKNSIDYIEFAERENDD